MREVCACAGSNTSGPTGFPALSPTPRHRTQARDSYLDGMTRGLAVEMQREMDSLLERTRQERRRVDRTDWDAGAREDQSLLRRESVTARTAKVAHGDFRSRSAAISGTPRSCSRAFKLNVRPPVAITTSTSDDGAGDEALRTGCFRESGCLVSDCAAVLADLRLDHDGERLRWQQGSRDPA